jgi:acyl-CoA synthetase (NDP forming)
VRRISRSRDLKIYLVNERVDEILDRSAVASLSEIDEPLDLVVISVSASRLAGALGDLARADVKACVVLATHVSAADKQRMSEIRSERGVRFLGPNSAGLISGKAQLDSIIGAMGVAPKHDARGPMILGQSGGFCTEAMRLLQRIGIGPSYVISTGDEVDTSVEDFLEWVIDEPTLPSSVILFCETVRYPTRFRNALRALSAAGIPVLVTKVGRTAKAAEAAASHTGAMVGDWETFGAVVDADGAILCSSVSELVECANLAHGIRRRKWVLGRRVVLATNSGGTGGLSADLLDDAGLRLADLSKTSMTQLSSMVYDAGGHVNPFDGADAGGLGSSLPKFLTVVGRDPEVDIIVVEVRGGIPYGEEAEILAAMVPSIQKPTVCCWPGMDDSARELLGRHGVPLSESPERLWRALALLAGWEERRVTDNESLEFGSTDSGGDHTRLDLLPYHESRQFLAEANVSQPAFMIVDPADAGGPPPRGAFQTLAFPVYVKVSSKRFTHKAAAGGVFPDVESPPAVRKILAALETHADDRYVVEERIEGGPQLLVTIRRTDFGVLVVLGWGGSETEYIADTRAIIEPFTARRIERAFTSTKVAAKLAGWDSSFSGSAVYEFVMGLVQALSESETAAEIEVNPAIVTREGIVAADARVLVRRPAV